MIISLKHKDQCYTCNLARPIDCSIPVGKVNCFHSTQYQTTPYKAGHFIGSIAEGGPVNFFDIVMNPHGNGTHTECIGHITIDQESINDTLKQFHFIAGVISIAITKLSNGDEVIDHQHLEEAYIQLGYHQSRPDALMIRTMPNSINKLTMDYSDTNPPYLTKEAMQYLVNMDVKHLLLDLPSVDREYDEGKLACHRIFWNMSISGRKGDHNTPRHDRTITELIYIPDTVTDSLYLLNLQIPSINLDATPSKPVIYKLNQA